MKTKELGWIQNIGIEDFHGCITVHQGQVLNIWENYITELYDRANRPEDLQVETEEKVDEDEKGSYSLQSEVEESYQGDEG
jgi:hypothetical protein